MAAVTESWLGIKDSHQQAEGVHAHWQCSMGQAACYQLTSAQGLLSSVLHVGESGQIIKAKYLY